MDAAATWQEHGWALVPGLVPTAEIDAALGDLWTMFPDAATFHGDAADERREQYFSRRDPDLAHMPAPDRGPAFRADQFLGMRTFPFPGSGRLNRLVVHPEVLRFAREALGTADLRLYGASAWAKYTGVVDYEQPLHRDANHSLLPPRPAAPWWHMEGFLYLSDVGAGDGATRLLADGTSGEEVAAPGPRGSFLAYRPDVWHRATDLDTPGGARFVLGVAYKPAALEWVGYSPLANLAPNLFMQRFVAGCTPEELRLFGIPGPGHAVWTERLVIEFAAMYPGVDVTPWQAELRR